MARYQNGTMPMRHNTEITTRRQPKTTLNPKRVRKTTLCQDSKAKVEEEESTEQHTEMCRSTSLHNRNQQRDPTTFDPTQKTTRTQLTRRDSTAQTSTRSPSRWSRSRRSLTIDDRIHELVQELSELNDSHWEICHDRRDLENTKRRTMDNKARAHFRVTVNSKACHGTAIVIHKRYQGSAALLTRQKEVTSVYFPHKGHGGDEHVQQVYSELQKHTGRRRKTDRHTHADE